MASLLLREEDGATAVLTLNRPEHRNALDVSIREELAEAIVRVRDDSRIKAVVLTGSGGHFCAGGDIKSGIDTRGDIFEGRERMRRSHRWLDELVDLEKPVIAAVEGSAFGAGLSLALAADFIVAAPSARFCSAFTRLGFVPDLGAMYLLPRAIGLARAKHMVFSARVVDAGEALAMGLVHEVAHNGAMAEALALARRFHTAPTDALGIAKSVMNHSFESERRVVYAHEAMAQAICRESAFHQEAASRFLGKKPALYEWK